jgi:protein-ribulosamine 3-kinase
MTPSSLSNTLTATVEKEIANVVGHSQRIVAAERLSGGCIHHAVKLTTNRQSRFFCKSNESAGAADMFAAEACGLQALRSTGVVCVPDVIGYGETERGEAYLILEWIEPSKPGRKFYEQFGRELAHLHLAEVSETFGFSGGNFIGLTPQPNPPTDDWNEFWIHHRIEFQLQLAVQNGYREMARYGSDAFDAIGRLIESDTARPSLIHGDLWSGNFLATETGRPALIDPAAYFAHREAEFGMTTLFGGFDRRFYDAYDETYPLAEGWEDRVEVYRLYHLLNHLNLFGGSYLSGCRQILNKFV